MQIIMLSGKNTLTNWPLSTIIRLCFTGKWGGLVVTPWHLAENIYLIGLAFVTFQNTLVYLQALLHRKEAYAILKTRSGLQITFRQNIYDARILRESFLEKNYLNGTLNFGVIIDVGAYIGDFALYAAKHLGSRVIAFEPTEENLSLLERNVRNNHLIDCVSISPPAVSAKGGPLTLFVQTDRAGEIHASSNTYGILYSNPSTRIVESISISQILAAYNLARVDLLKVDIEGGEYDVFDSMCDEDFAKISNIVFEYHPISGYKARLSSILQGTSKNQNAA